MSSLAESISTHNHVAAKPVPLAVLDFEKQTAELPRNEPIASEDYHKVVEAATGYPVPEGQDVVLERMTLHQAPHGVQYWYKFKFVERALELNADRPSLLELFGWVRKQPRRTRSISGRHGGTAVLNIADLQLGKFDRHGGTEETVKGFYEGVELMKAYIRQNGCDKAVLTELGDGVENFQNTASQAQTNDRQLIEQLDLHTELLTYAAVQISKEVTDLTVVGVPSNHMEVREDGKAVGGVHNDYGLLSLSSVKRALKLNPEAFGHVSFAWPVDHEISLTIDVNGVPVGFAHGHYSRGAGAADGVPKWLTGQFAGNHPLQPAHIIVTAHFHHLRMQNLIGGRWWFQAPTLDRGSSWLEHSNGEGNSQNGILAFTVRDGSWTNLELLRTN